MVVVLRFGLTPHDRTAYNCTSKFNVALKTLLRKGIRNQNFMVTWFTNLGNFFEGMLFLFSSEKSLYVTNA